MKTNQSKNKEILENKRLEKEKANQNQPERLPHQHEIMKKRSPQAPGTRAQRRDLRPQRPL